MSKLKTKHALELRDQFQALYEGCYAFTAVLDVAQKACAEGVAKGEVSLTNARLVYRKRGDSHQYAFEHYLKHAFEVSAVAMPIQASWFSMAIITAASALSPYNYFNRPPHLEVIYHLRNALAHGNRFRFTKECRERLRDYPATTMGARPAGLTQFEITEKVDGTSPADFLGPGDLIDVLIYATVYLAELADGREAFLSYPRKQTIA